MSASIRARGAVAALAAACLAGPVGAQPGPEQQFNAAVDLLRAGRSGDALSALESLTHKEPTFRLGQLFYGELLAALSGVRREILIPEGPDADPRLRDLAEEARVRLAGERTVPAPGMIPSSVLQLSEGFEHAVVVDLPKARLYVVKNEGGALHVERHHYAAMGRKGYGKQTAGDLRTPVGLYHATHWIGDEALPELYGSGALPLDYPNPWDTLKKRTGSGIWLHGVPRDTYSRPPRSSEGCVTMANADLDTLRRYVRFGRTPVLLSDRLDWVPAESVAPLRDSFLKRIEDWRRKWSGKDTEGYLAYYADDFTVDGMDRKAFAAHKRRVNASKKFIDVRLSDISLFKYPVDGEDIFLAEFQMEYSSDNFAVTARKDQFWRRNGSGSWHIVREVNQ